MRTNKAKLSLIVLGSLFFALNSATNSLAAQKAENALDRLAVEMSTPTTLAVVVQNPPAEGENKNKVSRRSSEQFKEYVEGFVSRRIGYNQERFESLCEDYEHSKKWYRGENLSKGLKVCAGLSTISDDILIKISSFTCVDRQTLSTVTSTIAFAAIGADFILNTCFQHKLISKGIATKSYEDFLADQAKILEPQLKESLKEILASQKLEYVFKEDILKSAVVSEYRKLVRKKPCMQRLRSYFKKES